MAACPSCGMENPPGFRFCGTCATPLGGGATGATGATGPAEERKVVTALFCDLIGFTASSESADPEDVDRMLSDYFAMARAGIEAHGGIVEKFIGDAVVGVFGVPAAHEDDPERAVRAGLRIVRDAATLEAVGGAPLRLRVGINTGQALVRLGVAPGSGTGFMVGDAINTASRLQSVAPEMGVAVGLATFEATAAAFDFVELEPATLKGKADPVRVFHAMAPRTRSGSNLVRPPDSAFVGREIDLALLRAVFEKAVATDTVQLVTVVGEPGIGKSRIVAELGASVDARSELVTWRQGRCLPYGEGITFWALGEIVKEHAGIRESDPPDAVYAKLDAVLPDSPERAWIGQRLLPLLGIEAGSAAEREELFTAWRRFLEQIAEDTPTVLVFEDLHWADEAMLSFLEHLADRAEGVPLLVIGTARPELFERHPGFGAGLRNATPVSLSPLPPEASVRLVSGLLGATAVPTELQRILARTGGNPLYAGELVRLLKDRDLLTRAGSGWTLRDGAEVPFPDSIQALIAARLDTLPSTAKSMLADAAVVGETFWAGAVAAMGDRDPGEVTDILRQLSRKELVRPARRSSIQGEAEYAFWHVLTRDVAYAQVPRASRATRHVAAAAWIESRASERIEDVADVLAHHYTTALDLARATRQADLAAHLEGPALRFLTLAGERAIGLDTAAAIRSFERALALTPIGHPDRPDTLGRFGEATLQAGRLAEATEALTEAIASYRARGDHGAATGAVETLGNVFFALGDPRWAELPAEALAELEPLPPGPELVAALTEVARVETIQGLLEAGIAHAERALAMGEDLGLSRSARALGYRGMARGNLGDPRGLDDMREALALASEAGQGREVALLHNNLGMGLWTLEGPVAAIKVWREGIAFAGARGLTEVVDFTTAGMLCALVDTGDLDEALQLAGPLAERLEANEFAMDLATVRSVQGRILALRGQAPLSIDSIAWLESTGSMTSTPEAATQGLEAAALLCASLGSVDRARALLERVEGDPSRRQTPYYSVLLPEMVRTALAIPDAELAERLVTGVMPRGRYAEQALLAADAALVEARGDLRAASGRYADAADGWGLLGVVPEEAFALLGSGRSLAALGRRSEATPALHRARELFASLRAAPMLAETDRHLVALAGAASGS